MVAFLTLQHIKHPDLVSLTPSDLLFCRQIAKLTHTKPMSDNSKARLLRSLRTMESPALSLYP